MSLSDRLAAVENQAEIKDATRNKPMPKGWEPGVVWHGRKGEVTSDPLTEKPTCWDDILESRGLDPTIYEVVGDTIKWTSWDGWTKTAEGETEPAICYSYKAEIRLKKSTVEEYLPIPEELYTDARKTKKGKKTPPTGGSTFVVALSDWQVGNRDGGGVERQAAAIANLVDSIPDRLADLRRMRHQIGEVAILGLGDLVEGTCGHYPAQQFRVEIDRRDQMKLVRRGIRDIIMAVSKHAEKVTVAAIPGNHGENRQNGRSITAVHDNDDVAVFEQVAEILAVNPEAFGHVGFKLSRDEIALSLNLSGRIVAITHGHTSKAGGSAAKSMWDWWQNQSMGRAYPGVADADILISGHYHHLNVKEQESRALFVCPSLTQVGEYFQDTYGVKTRAGTLSMLIDADGWGEMTLL